MYGEFWPGIGAQKRERQYVALGSTSFGTLFHNGCARNSVTYVEGGNYVDQWFLIASVSGCIT